jgi:predicted dehydrogenase
MAGETLRIGFVGAGAINRTRHVPGLKKIPGVEFEVVANRSQASSQAAANEYGIKRTAANWMEVVEDPNVGSTSSPRPAWRWITPTPN